MRAAVLSLVLCCALPALSACGTSSISGAKGDAGSEQAPRIVTRAEGGPLRELFEKETGITQWTEPSGAGPEWKDEKQGRDAVQRSISASAAGLAAVDYPSLSLPDFVTATRGLRVEPGMFGTGDLLLEAYGQDATGGRWTLYSWRGPELPQHPERRLVNRWIEVYVLYNLSTARVSVLIPTIAGEAIE
ncbi:MAG TPA: hypothetical protein VM409_02190 [Chloroflexia bacterium]|nr:hypothetical protein [Chloroflexia bacterium]